MAGIFEGNKALKIEGIIKEYYEMIKVGACSNPIKLEEMLICMHIQL